MYPELICPSDPTHIATHDAPTNYLANWYAFTNAKMYAFHPAQRFGDLLDGLSNVVLFAEGYSQCDRTPRIALWSDHYHNFGITQQGKPSDDPSYSPADYTMFQVQVQPSKCDKWRTQTPHSHMHVALADGSVHSVAGTISPVVWTHLLKPRDGAAVGDEWQQ
jgi:hypothetical protein